MLIQKNKHNIISIVTIIAFIVAWTVFSIFCDTNVKTVPRIQDVVKTIFTITIDGYKGSTLLQHLGVSFFRLFSAFILATFTLPLGKPRGLSE